MKKPFDFSILNNFPKFVFDDLKLFLDDLNRLNS